MLVCELLLRLRSMVIIGSVDVLFQHLILLHLVCQIDVLVLLHVDELIALLPLEFLQVVDVVSRCSGKSAGSGDCGSFWNRNEVLGPARSTSSTGLTIT